MRIGIDARFLTHPQPGGFKTYTSQLVMALAAAGGPHEYVLYLDRAPDATTPVPRGANVSTRVVAGTMPLVGMPWREQVALRRAIATDRLDLFHAPCLTAPLALPCSSVVTVFDTLWRRRSKLMGGPTSARRRALDWYYRVIPALAARGAATILTLSRAAKAEIVAGLGIDPGRIVVTPGGYGAAYRPFERAAAAEALGRRFGLRGTYLLAIGSADPRKNLRALIAAYALLPAELRARARLVIVWTHQRLADTLAREAAAAGVRDQVQYLTGVTDEELALLYNAAELFVFPSLSEGFGLPPLEAMACGAAVVAADNSSIPEVTGQAALLVDASDPRALSEAIGRALGNPALRATLRAQGLERAASFSWARCARETIVAYERAMLVGS